jgi:hypothetical protein
MNRVPMTVSDLVKLTRDINQSIRLFFSDTGVIDYPVLDGVSNGWAGNTIYHQHFQFFHPEHPSPITSARAASRASIIDRDELTVQRLRWPTPVYRINAGDPLNTGLVGNDLSGIWRMMGGTRRLPYKLFHDGYTPGERDLVPAHTQNLYVPGRGAGRSAYLILRDRGRVDYRPDPGDYVNRAKRQKAQAKENIGVMEATGTMIVDERHRFDAMKRWSPAELSMQMNLLLEAISPDAETISEFEATVSELFPQ